MKIVPNRWRHLKVIFTMQMNRKNCRGFTLIELMVALFIYTILSMLLMSGLKSVINAQNGTEIKAEKLHVIQRGMLVLSRDLEQIINRPITNADGTEEPGFIGTIKSLTVTHLGSGDPSGQSLKSNMQRISYAYYDQALWRHVASALDQTVKVEIKKRPLFPGLSKMTFQYLDSEKHWQSVWPSGDNDADQLPKAIKVSLTFKEWGTLSQIYVVNAQSKKTLSPSEKH